MANDIKQKIVLEGEKQYNQALNDAKRNLKTLRSELKAETAELGANATAQQKNEVRTKSLQKQIKEQEKVVKTYQEALKEVKEKYGDNEEAIAKWELKLNDARTSLANMKNELDSVGQSFNNIQNSADMATVASKSVADSFGRLSEIGGAISDSIETAFSGLVSMAKQTIEAIWNDIVDLAAKSNNMVDLAGFWNTDVTTIQKYAGAVQTVSGNLQDLNSLVTKINSADTKKVTELTSVSKENYKDQWEYAMAVMDALSAMNTEARNNAAFDIFGGKQATKAFDLLNDWKKLQSNLDKYDAEKGGYGLTEEELQQMSDLYDKVNGIKASWESLKSMAEVHLFGDLAVNISTNAQNILDALLKYMNADDQATRDEAIDEIEKSILSMFEAAKDAIEKGIGLLDQIANDLKESDNPTAKALGNILSGLVDALQWLTEDNMTHVVSALEILAGFWITGKGLQMGNKILEIVSNMNTIKTFKFLSSGADIASGAGAAGTAAGASFGTAFLNAFVAAAPVLAQVLGITALAVAPAVAAQAKDEQRVEEKRAERMEAAAKMTGESAEFLEKAADALGVKRDENGNKVTNMFGQGWIGGSEQEIIDLLYGLGDRSGIEKAKLQSLLIGSTTSMGNDTWLDLQRLWSGELTAQGLDDMGRLTSILEAVANAYTEHGSRDEWWKTQGGNAGNQDGMTSADAKSMTDAVNRMPKAVAQGVSGIRVYMDGASVGRLVAPYVSQHIATAIG